MDAKKVLELLRENLSTKVMARFGGESPDVVMFTNCVIEALNATIEDLDRDKE